ncbi:uncharacterized protein LOC111241142 isoform X2 [Vigna radiata var. radiata]|uniref:Uncharacterized protein LOC111241142 isoform X2 n=1 Tax=Vigna radiata var. radiata TaxID=3916 RepID=A0A3Q0EU19_VIGRR|nr:uncharacterized protein LOC111241142 isoform X2 [Vigna radiata var. radiata]
MGQMTTQLTEKQSYVSEESPFQAVQLPDDVDAIHIGDREQSHKSTIAPPTFSFSYAPTLALEEINEELEDQTEMRNTIVIGRPTSPSTTLPTSREVEVNIPVIDSVVDDYVDDRRYI